MHIAYSLHAQVQNFFPGGGGVYGFQGQGLRGVYSRPIFDNFTM